MDYIEAMILDYLKLHGKATRRQLEYLTGLEDRTNRKAVERLRRQGEPIGRGSNNGYTYNRPADVRRITKEMDAKAYSLLKTSAALKGRPLEGQLTIKEVLNDVLL